MGIRSLNRYLRDNCPDSIRCINVAELSGKIIAVDISIYLYRYETENALLENIFSMLSIFRHYNIIPIFIFDGKPPPEKKETMVKRKEYKEDAMEEYKNIKCKLEHNDFANKFDKQELVNKMEYLKKQFVCLSKDKIGKVKNLISAYGASYFDAPGEADELCASLVIKKKAWACLSEDTDLFVYGCTRVLRYFSLINHTVILYYTKGILQELKISQPEFRQVCVLSGTDYNLNVNAEADSNLLSNERSVSQMFKYFRKYKKSNDNNCCFYDWLEKTDNYLGDIDIDLLDKIVNMFSLNFTQEKLNLINSVRITNVPIKQKVVEQIMAEEDFIFL